MDYDELNNLVCSECGCYNCDDLKCGDCVKEEIQKNKRNDLIELEFHENAILLNILAKEIEQETNESRRQALKIMLEKVSKSAILRGNFKA